MKMNMMTKKRKATTTSLLPVIRNMKKATTRTMTTIMKKMKTTTTIMSNLIPGMRTKKMTTTAADAAMKTTTMIAVTASHGVGVSRAMGADNMKPGATTAAEAVPALARANADAPHPAGAPLQWTVTMSGASPAKAAGHPMKAGVGTAMTKAAAVARAADPPITVALPLPQVVGVHPTALTFPVAAGRVHLPGIILVLPGTVTRANNAAPADSSPAGAAVRVMAAGPIPVATIAATANHS